MAKKKQTRSSNDQNSGDGDAEINFEKLLANVEAVVEKLESGDLGLSESLEQYEKGIRMVQQCHQVLEQAEQRISVLTRVDEDGTAHVEPVDTGLQGSRSPNSASEGTEPAPKKRVKKQARQTEENMDDPQGLF